MNNLKVAVTGANAEQLVEIKKVLEAKGIELVELSDNNGNVTVVDAHWLTNIPEDAVAIGAVCPTETMLPDLSNFKDTSYDDGKQHWRGGARGRKGKIKYERR